MKWIKIEGTSVPHGNGIRKIKVGGRSVCIIRDDGNVYATSVRCPHAGADLSAGWCEAGRLICPYHRHAFDLKSGRGDAGQGNYIRVYPIEERDSGWFIGVEESWLGKWFKNVNSS